MALQAAKHMIWDNIILEANKFRPYLDYIGDQESALIVTKQNILIVKQGLNKKPMEVAQNAINFLSALSEDQVRRFGIQDKFVIVPLARKVIGKYRMLDVVQDKLDIISHRVKEVTNLFTPLVNRGIPFFWEEMGPLFSQEEYMEKLVNCRSDHSKFQDMQQA